VSHEEFFNRLPQYQGDESGGEGENRDQLEFFSPEFPIHALPPALSEIVGHFSTHNRAPVSANATAALSVLGACAGRRLRIDTHPGRYTTANLYCMVAQRSGRGKSETLRPWLAPIQDFEQARLEAHKQQRIMRRTQIQVFEAQLKKLRGQISKARDDAHGQAMQREMQAINEGIEHNQSQLAEPQLLVNDATQEALSVIMADNDQFAFSVTAEGKLVLQNLTGKYNEQGESEQSLYLKAFSGDFWRSNRISRNRVHLDLPCLACLWMVQISVLKRILNQKDLMEEGLLPRFLFCICMEPMPLIDPDRPPDPALVDDWASRCTSVLRTYHSAKVFYTVPVEKPAYRHFVEFTNAAIMRMNNGLEDVQSFVARWGEIAFRIALVLHLAQHGAQAHTAALRLETAQNAIELIKYYAEVQMHLLAPQTENEQFRRGRQLYRILIERYDGSQTLREVNRRNGFKSTEVETLAAKYPNWLRVEGIPTVAGGTPKRMVSAIRAS